MPHPIRLRPFALALLQVPQDSRPNVAFTPSERSPAFRAILRKVRGTL